MATATPIVVRPAVRADLTVLGRLGADLVRQHYELDPARFLAPQGKIEEGYAWFLGEQLSRPEAMVLVAAFEEQVLGYVYGAIEPLSWEELREECGYLHDLVVAEQARRRGVATLLVEAAMAWFTERGQPRVILHTAEQNMRAQRLFARLGFRRTMLELTRETGAGS